LGWVCSPPAPEGWESSPPPPAPGWESPSSCSCISLDQEMDIDHAKGYPDHVRVYPDQGRVYPDHGKVFPDQQRILSDDYRSRVAYKDYLHCSYSVGDQLHCTPDPAEAYYRVEEVGDGMGENQATQTEAENQTFKPRRPTNFNNGGVLWNQVRSQEELNSSCQNFPFNQQICGQDMTGSMRRPKPAKVVPAAPIFQRLLEGQNARHAHKLVSCPNIAVKCDIVEYL